MITIEELLASATPPTTISMTLALSSSLLNRIERTMSRGTPLEYAGRSWAIFLIDWQEGRAVVILSLLSPVSSGKA